MESKESKMPLIPQNLDAEISEHRTYIRLGHHIIDCDTLLQFDMLCMTKEIRMDDVIVPTLFGGVKITQEPKTYHTVWGQKIDEYCEDIWITDYTTETDAKIAIMFLVGVADKLNEDALGVDEEKLNRIGRVSVVPGVEEEPEPPAPSTCRCDSVPEE